MTCHQESGRAQGVPAIVGWPDEQFVAVMLSYKNRERPNPIMQAIAGRLSQAEIEALAAWFGAKARRNPQDSGTSIETRKICRSRFPPRLHCIITSSIR